MVNRFLKGITALNQQTTITNTRTHIFPSVLGSLLIRRCPDVQPQSLTELGAARSKIGSAQGLGTPHALN